MDDKISENITENYFKNAKNTESVGITCLFDENKNKKQNVVNTITGYDDEFPIS